MTPDEIKGILVMLNNYFHDLATAVFAVSALGAYFLQRTLAMRAAPEVVRPVAEGLRKVGIYALVWTLAGGYLRGRFYHQYEYMEAAGRGQVPALIAKHVLLVVLVTLGAIALYKVRKISYTGECKEVSI
jgi:hypothetical protein